MVDKKSLIVYIPPMSGVRRNVPEVIITPDPSRPDLTLVQFGDFPFSYDAKYNCESRAPLALRFSELKKAPEAVAYLTQVLAERVKNHGIVPDAACGIFPGGVRFSRGVAEFFSVPELGFIPKKRRLIGFNGKWPLEGECIVIDEEMIFGKGVLQASRVLKGVGLTVKAALSVVSYDLPQIRTKLGNSGIREYSLTTFREVVEHPAFTDRFLPEQVSLARKWTQARW